jgi:hypothetical protein
LAELWAATTQLSKALQGQQEKHKLRGALSKQLEHDLELKQQQAGSWDTC